MSILWYLIIWYTIITQLLNMFKLYIGYQLVRPHGLNVVLVIPMSFWHLFMYMGTNKYYGKCTHDSRRAESTVLTLCPLNASAMENQCEIKVTGDPSSPSAHTSTRVCIKMSHTVRGPICQRVCVCA